ncbi:MAG: hypothetical protein FWC43_01485 [Planctomycetaceae bacterium]|nr:hypothetical protein [Planctomycetaceae bacterium]
MQRFTAILVLFLANFTASVIIGEEANHSDFLRIAREEGQKRPKSLDTAVVRYTGEKVQVDLVAAVHIAEKRYYEELNERFKNYDVVLYELVIPEGTEVNEELFVRRSEKKGESNLLSTFQVAFSDTLGLTHQLKGVDYTAKNFVHADMTAEEFLGRVAERGDLASVFSRAMVHSFSEQAAAQSGRVEGRLFASLFSKNKNLTLKRLFAEEMVNQMDSAMWIISGDEGSAIITDRNAIALKKLREQIGAGKEKIAIFYGAAHLKEFAQSLQKEFQMEKNKTDWIVAWDLSK